MKKIIYIILILLAYNCQNEGKSNENIFIGETIFIDKFPLDLSLKGEYISLTSLGAESMYSIDTFLIFISSKIDTFYSVYSTKTEKHILNLLPKGRGINEFSNANSPLLNCIDSNCMKIYLFDRTHSCISTLNLTKSLQNLTTILDSNTIDLNIEPEIKGAFLLNDSSLFYHYFSFSNRNEYYSIYNRKTNTFIQQDSIYRHSINNIGNIFLWTTHSCYNLGEQKYATAMEFLNQINLYSLPQKKAISLVYNGNISDLKKVEECPMPEKYTYYVDFTSTTKLLFGLYANQTRKDWALKDNITTEIHVIDWEGIPKFKLNIQEKLSKIAINEKEKIMYGLTQEEEVYKYNLEEIL